MTTRNTRHFIGAAFIFVIGLLLSCFSLWSLAKERGGANWFIYTVFGTISVYMCIASMRAMLTTSGKSAFRDVFPVSLSSSNSIEIPVQFPMRAGKLLIYPSRGVGFYRGEIVLIRKQKHGDLEMNRVSLPGMKPSLRIPVPKWLKWLHVQEAGSRLDFWPRGASRSFDPIIVPFAQPVDKNDVLLLKIDVRSVLAANGESSNDPVSDRVEICLKPDC